MLNKLHNFFFLPKSAFDLGVCRILFYLMVLFFVTANTEFVTSSTEISHWEPVSIHALFNFAPPSVDFVETLKPIWKIFLLLAAVGLATRYTTQIALWIGLYLLSLRYCYAIQRWNDAIIIQTMFVLAFSRCGDFLSLDAYFLRKNNKYSINKSGEYSWPIQAVRILWINVFFSAGVMKLVHSGFDWVNRKPLIFSLKYVSRYVFKNTEFSSQTAPVMYFLTQFPLICYLIGVYTISIELLSPLAVISKKARWVLLPSLYMMLIFIFAFLKYNFLMPLVCAGVFWVPWEQLFDIYRNFLRQRRIQRGITK